MLRKKLIGMVLRALLGLLCALPLLTGPVSARYTPVITIHKNELIDGFPHSVTFQLSADSDVEIKRVTLIYGVNTVSCVQSEARKDMDFTPGKSIDVQWEWDLDLSGNLPAGVKMVWQWELEDATGAVTRLDEQHTRYEDTNFKWQKVTQTPITVYWSAGSEDFGRALLQMALKSVDRLEKNAGLKVTEPIEISIYPSAEDMRASLVMKSEWAGGVAFPEYQVVLIGMAPADLDWGNEVIPHELAHLVTGMRIFNCQGGHLPTWLNEGLSQYAEGPVTKATENRIKLALKNGALPPLSSLANGFPANSDLANQAYDQSWMVTAFMVDTYGNEKLNALFDEVRSGKSIDKALRNVYGLDTDGMDQTWRASLGYGKAPEPGNPTETATPAHTKVPTLPLNGSIYGQATETPTPTTTRPKPTDEDVAYLMTLIAQTKTATSTPSPTVFMTTPKSTDEDIAYLMTGVAKTKAAANSPFRPGGTPALWILTGAVGSMICVAGVAAVAILFLVLKKKG